MLNSFRASRALSVRSPISTRSGASAAISSDRTEITRTFSMCVIGRSNIAATLPTLPSMIRCFFGGNM
jgi:hypothetical protein